MGDHAGVLRRAVLVVAGLTLLASCGHGAPGGFPGPRLASGSTLAAASSSTSTTTSTTRASSGSTTNTIPQGSPIPPPNTEATEGDARVAVTLAKGEVTPSVKEVRARRVAFVVSNDDDVARSLRVAAASGTALVGTDLIRPDGVATLSVELTPGRYLLVADGGDKPKATVDFTVSPR